MAVKIIGVIPAYKHKVNIQWELDTASPGSHDFEVEKSGSPQGPWETITPAPLTDVLTFEDNEAQLLALDRDIYYRIKATSGGSPFYSEPHNIIGDWDRRRYLLWRKMNYDEEIMLKKGNGVQLKVIKKMHWGTRCTECYDEATGMTIKSQCDSCKGTSWNTGYYTPIDTWGHIKPSSVRTSETSPGAIVNVDQTNGFLLNFPIVKKDDIIVEPSTNSRWLVVSEQPTELIRKTVHQDIVLTRIPRSSIEYNISI